MKHLGDITKIKNAPFVDCITQRLEEQYECTGGWKVSDPKTRPFKFSNEMEDWGYHG